METKWSSHLAVGQTGAGLCSLTVMPPVPPGTYRRSGPGPGGTDSGLGEQACGAEVCQSRTVQSHCTECPGLSGTLKEGDSSVREDSLPWQDFPPRTTQTSTTPAFASLKEKKAASHTSKHFSLHGGGIGCNLSRKAQNGEDLHCQDLERFLFLPGGPGHYPPLFNVLIK